MFPHVEFPLFAEVQQASGQQRQYLEPRINSAAAGTFSSAAVGADGSLLFRRQVKGRYVHYHTPCLPLAQPNIRTPYDTVGTFPSVMSQVTYLQWNYKDVYIPPHLLHELLTETTALERQNVEYDPLLGSAMASLSFPHHTCLFHATGPLLQTLTCSVVLHTSSHPLSLVECESHQVPGRILEILATTAQGKASVCARTSYHVAFFQGPSEEALSSVLSEGVRQEGREQIVTLLAIFQTDHCVASVTLSPYIAGEGLVVMETGGVYLWCQGQQLQVLQTPVTTPNVCSPTHFWRCCYGSHPRSIVLAEHSGVSLGDFRASKLQFTPLLTSPSEWLPDNSLISTISPSSHPHQLHISTSHSLLLVDTRQPRWPLLQESHDLGHAPQIISTTSSYDDHRLVMLCDCVDGECVVFTSTGGTPALAPPHITSAAHSVAKYGELEGLWQGKPALPLLGNRLQQPLAGGCVFTLREGSCGGEEKIERETFAAISMSLLGDLFYQLWSYGETLPTDTPTYCDDTWLQEAWLQEQELQVSVEEWNVTTYPVNFNPLLEYLESGCMLCPACLATQSTHHFPSSTPSHHTITTSQATPLQRRCLYCGGRLAPLRTRKLEQKLVAEGLMEDVMATDDETMATVKGVERLSTYCDLKEPVVGGNTADSTFWEGWREGEEEEELPVAVSTPTTKTSVRDKPSTPSSQTRARNKIVGF